MPLIRILRIRLRRDLVRMSPVVTGRGLYFDHVGTKIRQDYSGAGASDEARQVYYFQSRKNIFSRHCLSLMSVPPAVAGGTDLIATSSTLELRRAFLQKCLRALLLVLRGSAQPEE